MLRRVATRALLVFIAVAALVGFTAGPAMANQYPWPHNGCTSAPDRAIANFTHACNHHDGCYALHWAGRGACDQWFWNDMIAACRKLPFEMIGGCTGTAGLSLFISRAF